MEANVSLSTRRALYFRADFFLRFASRFFLFNQNSLLYTVCLVPCRFHCRSNCWLRSRRLNFVDEIIILNLFSVAVMTSNEMQSREIATWQRFKFIKFPRLTWVGLRSFPAIKQIVNLRKVITRLSPALQIHRQLFIYNHCMSKASFLFRVALSAFNWNVISKLIQSDVVNRKIPQNCVGTQSLICSSPRQPQVNLHPFVRSLQSDFLASSKVTLLETTQIIVQRLIKKNCLHSLVKLAALWLRDRDIVLTIPSLIDKSFSFN